LPLTHHQVDTVRVRVLDERHDGLAGAVGAAGGGSRRGRLAGQADRGGRPDPCRSEELPSAGLTHAGPPHRNAYVVSDVRHWCFGATPVPDWRVLECVGCRTVCSPTVASRRCTTRSTPTAATSTRTPPSRPSWARARSSTSAAAPGRSRCCWPRRVST